MPRQKAFLILVALVLTWGINWPIMKVGIAHIPPLWFATIRMLMGAVCLFAVLLVKGRVRLPDPHDVPIVLSVGLVQMACFMGVTNLALQHVPAGRSAVLAYTTPLWVTPLAAVLLKERLDALKLTGVGLGLAGVAALFNPAGFDWRDREVVLGNGMLMAAAFVWALTIVHVRAHRWRGTPLELAPWEMLIAALPLTVLSYWHEGPLRLEGSATVVAILVYNGPIATAFAFWAAVTVNKNLPAITASLGFLGVPVTGAIVAALALGEPLTPNLLLGLALILGGVAITTLAGRRPS